ncbi:Cytochrome b5-like heme/steroid binding domain [Dillenia turbinata]|uniref:Cytochrome b5-like heme/steroid binding domain n=1 Tax=Dillenia turbinata TaxID=194707 RepID=A0AAN8UN01_9MAGN
MSSDSKVILFEELAKHNHKNDCWLLINGKEKIALMFTGRFELNNSSAGYEGKVFAIMQVLTDILAQIHCMRIDVELSHNLASSILPQLQLTVSLWELFPYAKFLSASCVFLDHTTMIPSKPPICKLWINFSEGEHIMLVYDVTSFLDDHPGGDEVLLTAAEKDATNEFEDVGHSDSAREMMGKYYIGEIDASSIPKEHVQETPSATPGVMNQPNRGSDFMIKILQFLVPLLILGVAFALRSSIKKEE